MIGDSISAGGNVSGGVGSMPYVPTFGQMLVDSLKAQYE